MANQLPKLIVIRGTDDAVLSYMYESNKGAGLVCCNGGNVFDPLAKIEVEVARTNAKYMHLKFIHTNKYWSRNDNGICATSNQPDENVSKASCTLFEPTLLGNGLLKLTHVQSGRAVRVDTSTSVRGIYATTGTTATNFTYIDSDTLLRVPRRVVFRGDNNMYLKAYYNGYNHLQFGSANSADRYAAQQVEVQPTGHIRIKNEYFGKFWSCNGDHWIIADSGSNNNVDTLFWPVRVSGNIIALRSSQNNQYCKRFTDHATRRDVLRAFTSTIDQYARMRLEEPVLKREISDVNYRMMDGRVYDEKTFVAGTGSATNNSNTESRMTILVAYEKKQSSSFSGGFSIMTGVSTEIKTGIPFVAERRIEVPGEATTVLKEKTSKEETTRAEASYVAVVPPRSEMIVDLIATSGKCSVPFSYTQKDTSSTDGRPYTSRHTDGIYIGLNYYNIHFVQREVRRLKE